jgi:nucleoside-diphosphate-sugar epimerase
VDVIVHCASVVKLFSAKPYEDVYLPSVAGTLSILRSAMLSSTLKRFVFTSSTGAIYDFGLSGKPADHIYTEADWNDFAVKTIEEHKDAVFPVLAYLVRYHQHTHVSNRS